MMSDPRTPEWLFRWVLFSLSGFTVGMALWMMWRHLKNLVKLKHRWDVWFILVYAGMANLVGLLGELVWHTGGIPLTWRTVSFGLSLAAITIGLVGIAWSVGRRDKRATDDPEGEGGTDANT